MYFDVAIVGAGMAGASLAAELGNTASVLLLEMEDMPGRHATGRSAAFWSESYGGPMVAPLTTASGSWLAERGFLKSHGELHIGRTEDTPRMDAFEALYNGTSIKFDRLDPHTQVPGLRSDWTLGLAEPSCADIDVGAAHAYYLSAARKLNVRLVSDAQLETATHSTHGWTIHAGGVDYRAGILVNAAGAWADTVAERSGVRPIGITPYRRTMVQLRLRHPLPETVPIIFDIGQNFYFKPEGTDRLWLSPHDETPVPPHDVAPEELDIAKAVARLEEAVDWKIAALERRWAGLRSFAPDRLPVYGFDTRVESFFWFVGQGGCGIQTAPAAAKLAAALLLGATPDAMVAEIDSERYDPKRF